jgi:hypothetical protein
MKAFIFKLILDHFEGQGREEVAEYVHDKVGWQKFK